MPTPLSPAQILEALASIHEINSPRSIVENNRVSAIVIREGRVGFALMISPGEKTQFESIRAECEKRILALEGVEHVTVALTHHASAPSGIEEKKTDSRPLVRGRKKSDLAPANIKKIIAIAAGKGGVGKSTVTVGLASALAQKGLRVAIADLDIYGPSIPRMLGAVEMPEVIESKMQPIKVGAIEFISMGCLLPEHSATVWRGPMLTKALHQLLFTTRWSERDILLIDLPPGTGDVQLSLSEQCRIDGSVLVSTPQEIALLDVRKAADMWNKLDVPIIGIVENMSYLEQGGQKHYLFGQQKVERFAKENALSYLGDVAISPALSRAADAGKLLQESAKDFSLIADKLIVKI